MRDPEIHPKIVYIILIHCIGTSQKGTPRFGQSSSKAFSCGHQYGGSLGKGRGFYGLGLGVEGLGFGVWEDDLGLIYIYRERGIWRIKRKRKQKMT